MPNRNLQSADAIRIRGELGDLYPFTSHWQETPQGRLHYLDEGPGSGETSDAPPTLLFVHGNPTWSFHWRELIGKFSDRYRCVAVDHLGCGLSDLQPEPQSLADHIENLSGLIESLDLQNVTLIAQDWGGAIGLGAVLKLKERFERLVLLNTGAFPPWYIPWRIRVCRWPVVGKLMLQGFNAFSRAALTMTVNRGPLTEQVKTGYLAPYHNWERRAAVYQFVKDIPLSASHPTWQTLADIEAGLPSLGELPKLLVWGEQDWCFTTECLDKFVEIWPDSTVLRISDAGHWVVEDATEQVIARMERFLTAEPKEPAVHFDHREDTKGTRIV
ncbi:alpha/beta fold hydrolase [Adhaeretor mobilis]|uniref:Haloalkane dehalogenase n=1 Tax=Adhaeretor mobilis TaxID=1930276 RepID=A0A517MS76_9BACT|nr:alpha/beta fold hydrolase [Adhaeretor mobilis]QDS97726.1 Haloalkane dehalogenase [Adhaeretor mobilis]